MSDHLSVNGHLSTVLGDIDAGHRRVDQHQPKRPSDGAHRAMRKRLPAGLSSEI